MSVFDNKADHFNYINLITKKVYAYKNPVAHIVHQYSSDIPGTLVKIDHPLNDSYNLNANSTLENFYN